MKRELFAACAGAVAVMAGGWSGPAAAAPPELVPQGKLNSIILSPDVVGGIVGATMSNEKKWGTPFLPTKGLAKPECAVLFGLDTDSVGDDWEAFAADNQMDGDNDSGYNHLVVQDVGIYADADTPAKLFQSLSQSVSGCTGTIQVSSSGGGSTNWQVKGTPTVTSSGAQWVMSELSDGKPTGWRCAYDTRVQSNVLLDAVVCQFGNPVGTAKQIADRMTAGLSA